MKTKTMLAAALLCAGSLHAQYTMRSGVSSATGLTYYEYPVSGGALVYSGEYVPANLAAEVGFQLRILSNHNLIGARMSKPIVITEGFDADYGTSDRTSFESMEKLLSRVADLNTLENTSQPTLLKTLYDEGYEIILARYLNPTTRVTDNSWAVQGLTLKVASWLETYKTPIRFVGPSMGGLIERHALQTFRTRFSGILPNISHYVSFDSPHRGALIPMPVQAYLMFHSHGDADNSQKYRNILSNAAKDMLLYHEQRGSYDWDLGSAQTTVNGFENSATPHGQFMQALDNTLPELLNYSRWSYTSGDIGRAAILNGSGDGAGLGLTPNTLITRLKATSGDEIGRDNWYTHGGGRTQVYNAYIDSWGGEDDQNPFYYYLNGENCFVENAPGGTRNTYSEAAFIYETAEPDYADTFVDYWNPAFGPYPGNPAVKPVVTGSTPQGHSFVPSASALGLMPSLEGTNINGTGYWFRNLRSVAASPAFRNVSVFRRAYLPAKNQPHMYITTENKNWFLEELRNGNPNRDIQPGMNLLTL